MSLKTSEHLVTLEKRIFKLEGFFNERIGNICAAVKLALLHITDLEDLWQRGMLECRDGPEWVRANRNVEVRVALEEALRSLSSMLDKSQARAAAGEIEDGIGRERCDRGAGSWHGARRDFVAYGLRFPQQEWTLGAAFGPGPWENEPGRMEWRHKAMQCLLLRNTLGVWCGYVAVSPGHPLHGAGYGTLDIEVHGGLTYGGPGGAGICYTQQPGDANVWWLGFDCGHAFDLSPMIGSIGPAGGTYRTLDYARSETEKLAEKLASLKDAA